MNKEELYKEIDGVEQQISRIYFDIMDQSEISPYKKCLLEEKLNLLTMKLESVIFAITFINHNETQELRKKLKRTGILSILVLILMFINPLIALPLNLYTMHRLMKLKDQLFNKKDEERAKEVEQQLRTIKIIAQNCDTFMTSKYKKREERILEESIISDINHANAILGNILYTGKIIELPDEIKFYVIKMLQDDLETKEESLEELVKMAREKMSIETLNDDLELKLNLVKIE